MVSIPASYSKDLSSIPSDDLTFFQYLYSTVRGDENEWKKRPEIAHLKKRVAFTRKVGALTGLPSGSGSSPMVKSAW